MEYSEEWKSFFPISSVHSPPLLLNHASHLLGPLFFNPIPESLALLFSSPSLSPFFLNPPPHLSLSRFLETTSRDSPLLPTIASSISTSFDPRDPFCNFDAVIQNRIEPLSCPNNRVLIFFPTGSNLDRVGFVVLSVRDSKLAIDLSSDDPVITSQIKFHHQIVRLSACPLIDCSLSNVGGSDYVGFLLACSMYAVNWFSVRGHGFDSEKPTLVFMGSKKFTTSKVAYACWNPHLPGECLILLESGALFLFDMDSCSDLRFKGKRIYVAWDELGESAQSGWFGCEFSWHPRILVLANSKAIYLVDFRFGKCQVSCLLKIDILGSDVEKDRFVVCSKAGSDGFLYTVASEQWLMLCDVRKPLMPVLRWAHHMHEPRYMIVLPLSELRSHSLDDKHVGASAIILGSFWNNEFNVFCYGRPPPAAKKSFSAKKSNFSNSFYAWELPSQLLLCGQNCFCGSCLLREEFAKDDLPEWIEWQQKKELVLGFCILNKELSSLLSKPGEHGGFTLIRWLSTGKLESQQYCASWKTTRIPAVEHEEMPPYCKDSLLCSMGDEKYKFRRSFKYLKLEYLYGHLNANLAKVLISKFKNVPAIARVSKCHNERFCKFMSEKLKSFGCGPVSIADILKDVNMATSLYEVVSRVTWIALPMNILEVAFPHCSGVLGSDKKKGSVEFPVIPDRNQLPPFFLRSPSHNNNKWLGKVPPGDDFVGPVVPLPASCLLYQISKCGSSFVNEDFSFEEEFAGQCKSVVCLTKEMGAPNVSNKHNIEYAVSLKDEREDSWLSSSSPSSLFLYEPSAFSDEVEEPQVYVEGGDRFNMMVAKFAEDKGEVFDGLCPMELKFDLGAPKFSDEELSAYKLLKKQFSQWQDSFAPYQNLCAQLEQKISHPISCWRSTQ